MKTHQEFFDITVRHLRSMSWPSLEGDSCVYLSEHGEKCAIGAHLPKGPWSHSTAGVYSLLRKWPDLKDYLVDDINFLGRIQLLHDDLTNWEDGFVGEAKVQHIADDYGLTVPDALT